jgi:hypothetical protein
MYFLFRTGYRRELSLSSLQIQSSEAACRPVLLRRKASSQNQGCFSEVPKSGCMRDSSASDPRTELLCTANSRWAPANRPLPGLKTATPFRAPRHCCATPRQPAANSTCGYRRPEVSFAAIAAGNCRAFVEAPRLSILLTAIFLIVRPPPRRSQKHPGHRYLSSCDRWERRLGILRYGPLRQSSDCPGDGNLLFQNLKRACLVGRFLGSNRMLAGTEVVKCPCEMRAWSLSTKVLL